MPFWASMAQRTPSTTLRNSTMLPSAGTLHYAPVMGGDGGIDQIAPQCAQPRQRPFLVGTGKPAVSDHICRKDGCEFSGRHGSPFTTRQSSTQGLVRGPADARSGSPAIV
jgi:hypothetical protein